MPNVPARITGAQALASKTWGATQKAAGSPGPWGCEVTGEVPRRRALVPRHPRDVTSPPFYNNRCGSRAADWSPGEHRGPIRVTRAGPIRVFVGPVGHRESLPPGQRGQGTGETVGKAARASSEPLGAPLQKRRPWTWQKRKSTRLLLWSSPLELGLDRSQVKESPFTPGTQRTPVLEAGV